MKENIMKKAIIVSMAIMLLYGTCIFAQSTKVIVSRTGKVMDEKTFQPIGIKFKVYDSDGKLFTKGQSNSLDGYYFVTGLAPGQSYTLVFDDFGYFQQEYPFEIPKTQNYKEFTGDFLVKPKKVGISLPFIVPPYEINKSEVRQGADYLLKNMLMTLKFNRKMKFKIRCFPDNDKDPEANFVFTKKRADSMKAFFVNNGVEENRIVELIAEKYTDPDNKPPMHSRPKGKRYIGTTYIIVDSF